MLRRLLMRRHLVLTQLYLDPHSNADSPSVISDDCDVVECAEQAFEAVRRICIQKYNCSPELVVDERPTRPIRYVAVRNKHEPISIHACAHRLHIV